MPDRLPKALFLDSIPTWGGGEKWMLALRHSPPAVEQQEDSQISRSVN